MKHYPPKAEVTGSNPVGCASSFGNLRRIRALIGSRPSGSCHHEAMALRKGSSWRMSALLALLSIAMIGYLYGCETDDR